MFVPQWATVSCPGAIGPVENAIDVWLIDLDAAPMDLGNLLDDDERARAGRFVFPVHSRRFTAARGYLRLLLGIHLGCPPEAVAFDYGVWGKPMLRPAANEGLAFNLAHSGGLALITVGRTEALGVDIELIRPLPDLLDLASRTFAPGEVNALLALPPDEQLDGFFACWTRKEAIIKFWGEGLSADLASFEVNLDPQPAARLIKLERRGQETSDLMLYTFKAGPNVWAALAAPANSASPRFWQLRQ